MIIGYRNLLDKATLTTTSVDTSFPLVNILHPWARVEYHTQDGVLVATITAEFDTMYLFESFFVLNTNATEIECVLYDAQNNEVARVGNRWFGSVSAKKAVIELEADTTLYVGIIHLGKGLYNQKTMGQALPLRSTDSPTFSLDGQVGGRSGSVLRDGTGITIPYLSPTQRRELEMVYYEQGMTKPFVLDLWAGDEFDPLWCVFRGNLDVQQNYRGDTVTFSVTEVN